MLQGLVVATAVLGLSSTLVAAQSQASCSDSTWRWSYNSKNQDPCHVAQALGKPCDPTGEFVVPTLPFEYYYSGQNPQYATECVCNTVYYSLLSACGQCQDSYASPWPLWKANCTDTNLGVYPGSLPEGFPVPDWAFQPLLSNGTVNFAAAKVDTNPESTAPPSPSYTTPTTDDGPTGTDSGSRTGTGTNKPNGGGGSSVPIGAIVGGAVGGVAVIALIVLVVWLILRRRNHKLQAKERPVSSITNLNAGHPPSMISEKPYDPSDPSTYPGSLSPPVSPGPNSFITTPFVPGTGPVSPGGLDYISGGGRPESYNPYMQPQQTGQSGYTGLTTTTPPPPHPQPIPAPMAGQGQQPMFWQNQPPQGYAGGGGPAPPTVPQV